MAKPQVWLGSAHIVYQIGQYLSDVNEEDQVPGFLWWPWIIPVLSAVVVFGRNSILRLQYLLWSTRRAVA